MTGLIGPVTMAGFHCGENWLEIKALMTEADYLDNSPEEPYCLRGIP